MSPEAIISRCKELLHQNGVSIQTDPKTALPGLENIREPILGLRIERYKELCHKREQYRMPNYPTDHKDKTTPRYTDFDRRIMLEDAIADVQANYELVKGLEVLVKERMDLIKLLLEAGE